VFPVVQHIGEALEVELQALVLVSQVCSEPGVDPIVDGLVASGCRLGRDLGVFELRSSSGLAGGVRLDVAELLLSQISRLLALATQHALEE